ncbi:MAG: DUF5668 domain-containing protein [Anaerolineales bacterium]
MENNQVPETNSATRPHRRSFFWPIILIGLGALFLLNNLGIVSWNTWNMIWRFWPLILVAIGADLLIGHRSLLGSLLGALIALVLLVVIAAGVFFADQLPILARYATDGSWQTTQVEYALDPDFQSADVFIDWTSLPGHLYALEDDDYLIQGEVTYQGELEFNVDELDSMASIYLDSRWTGNWTSFSPSPQSTWEIGLSPEIPLNITLDSGSGSCDFDLSDLFLTELYLDSGSGSVSLALPADQSFAFKLDSGSGSLRIDIPEDSGIRVRLDSGSGSFNPGSDFELVSGDRRGDGVWESTNYQKTDYRIEMEIDQGSGSISFR